jgi:hypothetical protein
MNRRAFVTGLGAVLAAPIAAEAQQMGKVYRVVTIPPWLLLRADQVIE